MTKEEACSYINAIMVNEQAKEAIVLVLNEEGDQLQDALRVSARSGNSIQSAYLAGKLDVIRDILPLLARASDSYSPPHGE